MLVLAQHVHVQDRVVYQGPLEAEALVVGGHRGLFGALHCF